MNQEGSQLVINCQQLKLPSYNQYGAYEKDCEEKMNKHEVALQAKHKPNPGKISPLERLQRDIKMDLASGQGYPAKLVFEKLMAKYRDLA